MSGYDSDKVADLYKRVGVVQGKPHEEKPKSIFEGATYEVTIKATIKVEKVEEG